MYLPQVPLPSFFPALLYLTLPPDPPLPSTSLVKRAGLQETTSKKDTTRYNKAKQKASYQDWTRQPNRRKQVSRTGERERDTLDSTVRSPKNTDIRTMTYTQRTLAPLIFVFQSSNSFLLIPIYSGFSLFSLNYKEKYRLKFPISEKHSLLPVI